MSRDWADASIRFIFWQDDEDGKKLVLEDTDGYRLIVDVVETTITPAAVGVVELKAHAREVGPHD